MVFKTFQRLVYAALETTEGASITPDDSPMAYIESSDPTFSVTNRMFERNPTRQSITPVPQIVPGTLVTSASATIEFSFSVELAGSGTAATAPRWGRLLQACGMEEIVVEKAGTDAIAGAGTDRSNCLLNNERISSGAASITNFAGGTVRGRVVGDTFVNDTVYFNDDAGSGAISNNHEIAGEVTDTLLLTASASSSGAAGVAWAPKSTSVLGGGDDSSLTIRMVIGSDGSYIEGVGCRGNVEFVMTSGDRVVMNFTFTGRYSDYDTSGASANDNPATSGILVPPPAFVGTALAIQASDYAIGSASTVDTSVFTTLNINMGNEITTRESVAATSGYDVSYITGRAPTATFNPDAVTETTFGWWDQFLSGDVTRAKLTVGTDAGNQFEFRMPAMQFTGIADGNRDEVYVYDSSVNLTGGDYGSSIQEAATDTAASSTQTNSRLGTNNEFILYHI